MLIAQEENLVRLLRQMKDQGFESFVMLEGGVLSILVKILKAR